jgi:hypothetical protein
MIAFTFDRLIFKLTHHMSANAKDNLLEGITDYIKRVIGEIAEISLVSVPRDMYNL